MPALVFLDDRLVERVLFLEITYSNHHPQIHFGEILCRNQGYFKHELLSVAEFICGGILTDLNFMLPY